MSILDNVYNYYEKLVLEEVATQTKGSEFDQEFIIDVVCIALNRLPTRYFRHGVDMAFYLSSKDFVNMKEQVSQAVTEALKHLEKSERH
jgi:competence protein ComFB